MRLHVVVVSFLLLLAISSGAQLRPFGDAHAIVGARIEVGDGRVIEKGTVLIRDGLIEAVGKDLPVPPDAEVLKGDGLIVFPGFIDAWTTKGLKLPAWKPDQDAPPDAGAEASPSMREANRKWVRPELRAVEYLALSDSDAAPLRKSGFATVFAAPSGGLINGYGVLVGLSGRPKREAVVSVQPLACMAVKLPGGGDFFGGNPTYPATPLGLFSHLRQALLDARWYRELDGAFKAGGPRRPPADDVLAALQPVLAGETPVLLEAETQNEVIRAIHLADEFGLKPIVCGGQEAWKHAELLAKRQIPVVVSLKLPEEPKLPGEKPAGAGAGAAKPDEKKPDDKKPDDKKPDDKKPDEKKEPAEDPDAELAPAARKEKKRLWQEKLDNVKSLRQAGVPLAFTTRGTKDSGEFWTNLRRVVKEGLPREAALKALTVQPAKLFGLERRLGTVEAGKIATLTIMTADFTDEKAKTRYLFIDGRKFDTEIEPPASRPMGPPAGEEAGRGAGR